MPILWDDPVALWDDPTVTWDGEQIGTTPGPVIYLRPPEIEDDSPPAMTTMRIIALWCGADAAGITRRPL